MSSLYRAVTKMSPKFPVDPVEVVVSFL